MSLLCLVLHVRGGQGLTHLPWGAPAQLCLEPLPLICNQVLLPLLAAAFASCCLGLRCCCHTLLVPWLASTLAPADLRTAHGAALEAFTHASALARATRLQFTKRDGEFVMLGMGSNAVVYEATLQGTLPAAAKVRAVQQPAGLHIQANKRILMAQLVVCHHSSPAWPFLVLPHLHACLPTSCTPAHAPAACLLGCLPPHGPLGQAAMEVGLLVVLTAGYAGCRFMRWPLAPT